MREYVLIIGAFLTPLAVALGAWVIFTFVAWAFLGGAQ
jgi:hypothetical protein